MEVIRTFDLLDRYAEKFPKDDALCFKHDGEWKKFSSHEYIDYATSFCRGLYESGFRKGDKIITVSSNRPEWNFADIGMAMIGVVHVPVFASLNISEYQYIIRDSGAKMILISDARLYKCVAPAFDYPGFSSLVYTFDEIKGVSNWKEIINKGKNPEIGRAHV